MGRPKCEIRFLDCNSDGEHSKRDIWLNSTSVVRKCNAEREDVTFKFGIFADALTQDIVDASFIAKYLYCLWWGLRNLRYVFLHPISNFPTSFNMYISFTQYLIYVEPPQYGVACSYSTLFWWEKWVFRGVSFCLILDLKDTCTKQNLLMITYKNISNTTGVSQF